MDIRLYIYILISYLQFHLTLQSNNEEKIVVSQYELFYGSYYMFVQLSSNAFDYASLDITYPYNIQGDYFYHIPNTPEAKLIREAQFQYDANTTLDSQERVESYSLGYNVTYDVKIPEITFFLLKTNMPCEGNSERFAMAYSFPDKNHSITHQLKANGLIDHLSFTFERNNRQNGTLYFGGVPSNRTTGLSKTSCGVKGNLGYWDCQLSHVFIGEISYVYENTVYINPHFSYFSTEQKEIQAPKEFFDLLMKEVFNASLANGTCIKKDYGNEALECDCEFKAKFQPITFVFDGVAFTFRSEELFRQLDNLCDFMIVNNEKDNNWIIGNFFINKYITTFDYDEKAVIFYSNTTKFEVVKLDVLFPTKTLVTIIIVLVCLVLGVIIGRILYVKFKQRKSNRLNKAIEDVYDQLAQ